MLSKLILKNRLWLGLSPLLLVVACCCSPKDHNGTFVGNSQGDHSIDSPISIVYVSSHTPSTDTLKRAKEFRTEIDNAYKILKEKNIYGGPNTTVLLTQIARKYIPVGSRMTDVGDFLNAAGFIVSDYHKNGPYPRCFIGSLLMENYLLGHTDVFIQVRPQSDEDFIVSTIEMGMSTIGI